MKIMPFSFHHFFKVNSPMHKCNCTRAHNQATSSIIYFQWHVKHYGSNVVAQAYIHISEEPTTHRQDFDIPICFID